MKRKMDDGMVQSAIRLPPDLRQRLKRASGERSMGDEIRRRLEASFNAEKANPKTQDLLFAVSFLADKMDFYYVNWSEHAFAFEALKWCLDTLLTTIRPKGEAVLKTDPNQAQGGSGFANLFFDSEQSPKDIGRIIMGELMHAMAERAREKRR